MSIETTVADALIDWAAVPAPGVQSTIGRGDGKVIAARNIEELTDCANRSEPLTILAKGR